MVWIYVAQDRVLRRPFLNTVMNLRIIRKAGNLLTS
jgi:hypothetical protein